MIGRRGRLFAAGLGLTLAFLAEAPSCGAGAKPEPTPRVSAISAPPQVEVVFHVEIWDRHGRIRNRAVGVEISSFGFDGKLATAEDAVTHIQRPARFRVDPDPITPWTHPAIVYPDVAIVSMTIIYPMGRLGDTLRCYITEGGSELRGALTRSQLQIRSIPSGYAPLVYVSCAYTRVG